jgi:hypothetical protein
MTRTTIAAAAFLAALILLVVAAGIRDPVIDQEVPAAAPAAPEVHPGFIYGRVTDVDGGTFEGRMRWGRDQEAFWSDYFNGAKDDNPWAAYALKKRNPIEIFGFEIGSRERASNLARAFMARFGDIARIEAHLRKVNVTLKSGTTFVLNRNAAGDMDDGVRVWDGKRGVVDLDARRIRTIEFLETAPLVAAPERLYGTVRTRQGDFTGFIQWGRHDCVGTDTLDSRTADGKVSVPYDTIRSIVQHSPESGTVTLVDGREVVLSHTSEVGDGNRGIYVDDERYGRVLISWTAFERIDFSRRDSGPAYGNFAPGRALAGTVVTRDGRRLAGRLVYDFDESETTETLDAPFQGVDYTVPLNLITSIVLHGHEGRGAALATVILGNGEELPLERTGDLGEGNAGMLIFVDGRQSPEYVPWSDVAQVDFDRR